MRGVRERAWAKLNVFLRVLGRRPDGFHQIQSLVQPLTLADEVLAKPFGGGFWIVTTGERATDVPEGPENLLFRAAQALKEACGTEEGAQLELEKRIPVAAGLGGGSADAAATLRALNDLWGCGLGPEQLMRIGARVGSDVPALLPGGPVLARGRGDMIEKVEAPKTWWILRPLDFPVSAADAYRWWEEDGVTPGPDPAPILRSLGEPKRLGRLLFNDLEDSVAARHPAVRETKERVLEAGALGAVMCGSGPTVAGLCRDEAHAEDVATAVGGLATASITR